MRVSLEWLREYVELTVPSEELARRLTLSTVEIEAIEREHQWRHVSVGQVVDVRPHPNSDHLRLAVVDTGAQQVRVVCGAPNVATGQQIAYAGIGATLRDPATGQPRVLKAAKIRGEESNGMICSERELGLSDEHEGILVLPADAPVGQPLADTLGDVVLVAGAWAHRADLLSMLGFAREVSALTSRPVHMPDLTYEATAGPIEGHVEVELQAPELCSRYVVGLVEGVKIGPSPDWMQSRLKAAGQRPINNVVDITNYVMLEFGQPLHAFDYDRIRDRRIIVRRAQAGEQLTTLDGVRRSLNPDTLVIADPAGPVGLAGVMGGANSEVHEGTTSILLEAATFNGINVRRTSTALGLRSEASSRFEKGLPAELTMLAAQRAVELLVRYAGGRAYGGFIDAYPAPQPRPTVQLTAERLRRVLGIDVAAGEVVTTLDRLGFVCRQPSLGIYEVAVPYWRMDVRIPDDVVEEVIRIIGFDRLPETTISGRIPAYLPQPRRELRDRVKDTLVAAGAQEIITYSAVGEALLKAVTPVEDLAILRPLRVVNPMSTERELMRTSLRGSMLETIAANVRLRRPLLSLFETAVVFLPNEERTALPEERETLIGAICGRRADRWGSAAGEPVDFFDAKGYVEALDGRLRAGFAYQPASDPILLDGRTAAIQVGPTAVGVVGQVHPDVLARFDIDGELFMYEMDLAALLPLVGNVVRFKAISRFPAVEQDLALLVDRDVQAADLLAALRQSKLVGSVQIFDEYAGDRLPAGKKSLAFAVQYQSSEKTLTDEEVAREQRRLLERLRRQFGAELRS